MRVLGLSGSLRADSHNTRILRGAATLLPSGITLVEYPSLGELPLYNEDIDLDPAPAPVQHLRDAVADADALLFVTPEHNGTIPAAVKNAVDWASRPVADASLRGKPAGVIGSSVSQFGAVWAQADLRKALGIAGARVVGEQELPIGPVPAALDERGLPADAELTAQVRALLDRLCAEVEPARS